MSLKPLESSVLASEPQTPAATPASPTPAEPMPTPAPSPTPAEPAPAPAEEEDETGDAPLTSEEAEQELARLRRQAARYRTQRNEANAQLAQLRKDLEAAQSGAKASDPENRAAAAERRLARLELAADAGVSLQVLRAADQLAAATDEAGIRAALQVLQQQIAPAAPAPTPASAAPAAGIPTPPEAPTNTPSLDEQIAEAEKKGDYRAALRLKNQKLRAASAKK